jgi:hypothetical protein
MLNFEYPTDPKEQKLWQLEGRTPNSVLVGGKWRSLGSMGPIGAVLALGGGVAAGGPQKGATVAVKTLLDQPYVQGITQAAGALQDPGRYLANVEKGYASSVVPTAVSQVASAGDKLARQVNGVGDSVKAKIPGLRQTLAPKTNAFGQNVPNGESGPLAPFDPFYSSKSLASDKVTTEARRLQDAGQGVLPASQPAKNTFNGVKTQLTKDQAQGLSTNIGQAVHGLWGQTINFDGYKNLPDDQKQLMLGNIMSDTTSALKEKYAAANQLGQYSPTYTGKPSTLTQKQQNIIEGKFNPADYLPKEAKSPAYTTSNGVRVKAPKAAKVAKLKVSKAKGTSSRKSAKIKIAIPKIARVKIGKLPKAHKSHQIKFAVAKIGKAPKKIKAF